MNCSTQRWQEKFPPREILWRHITPLHRSTPALSSVGAPQVPASPLNLSFAQRAYRCQGDRATLRRLPWRASRASVFADSAAEYPWQRGQEREHPENTRARPWTALLYSYLTYFTCLECRLLSLILWFSYSLTPSTVSIFLPACAYSRGAQGAVFISQLRATSRMSSCPSHRYIYTCALSLLQFFSLILLLARS